VSFLESPRFPEFISYGAVGGPEYKTDVVALDSGSEQRNIRWDQAKARYNVEMPLRDDRREILLAFFRALKGRGHGFRLKDWADYKATQANGRLGLATAASGVPAYQLYKFYEAGALSEYRIIRKPVVGKVEIYRGGMLQAAGAGAGNYAIDTTTGIVTFVADASRAVSNVSIASSAVITLASAIAGLTGGMRLYLSGINGTAGAVLNNLAHAITGVSGAQYTIGTSTVGRTYTGGGTGATYAQPSETLAWAGEFDVPVRFDADYLPLTIEAQKLYRAQQVQLVEIRV
jgi:uncharacterized protein (TIGR02217 family)